MISVVVPTYRRPALLAATLASVQAQSFTDVEVLVCDNGADAQTRAVVDAVNDPRFRYVPRSHNLGIMGNTLAGFGQARGEYVFKLDDDDLPLPDSLELLHAALHRHPEAVLAFGTLLDVVATTNTHSPAELGELSVVGPRAPITPLQTGVYQGFVDLVARHDMHLGACLIRASALRGVAVNPAADTSFDLDVLFRLSAGTAVHVPDAVVHYRRHPGADSHVAPVQQSLGALASLDGLISEGLVRLTPAVLTTYAWAGANAATAYLRQGRVDEARAVLDGLPRQVRDKRIRRLRMLVRVPAIGAIAARAGRLRYREGTRATVAASALGARLGHVPSSGGSASL